MKSGGRAFAAIEEIINLQSSMFVGMAFMVSTGFNYGFQIISGRYLGSYEYGLLAGLISVMSITTIALSAFQVQTAKAIAAGQVDLPSKLIDEHFSNVTKFALVVSLFLLCGAPIASYFWNIGLLPIIFVCIYAVPAAWDSIAAGRFQGGKNFTGLAGYGLFQAIMKFLSLVIVIAVGLGVTSIIGLITVAATLVALLGIHRNKGLGTLKIKAFDRDTKRVLLTNAMFWLMLSMDVIIAPGVLGSNAGKYAAASTISKALLWTPALATQILFPHLSSRNLSAGGMSSLVRKGTFFTLAVALFSAIGLSFIGPLMVESLYGSSFDGGGQDLWKLCFALVPFSICQFLISVHFVNGHSLLLRVMLVMATIEGGSLLSFGSSITSFSLVLGITGLVLSIALVLFGENAKAFFGAKNYEKMA
jgi:O-antigen/teichoic acid export membrane protein